MLEGLDFESGVKTDDPSPDVSDDKPHPDNPAANVTTKANREMAPNVGCN